MYTGGSLRSPAAHALSSDTCGHEATAPIVAESASSSPDQRSVRQAAVPQEMVALPVGSFLETLHQNHQQRKGHQSQSEAAVQEGEEWAHWQTLRGLAVAAVTVVVEGSADFVEQPVQWGVLGSCSVEEPVVAVVPAAVVAEVSEAVSWEDWYQKYPAVCFVGRERERGRGRERERERE